MARMTLTQRFNLTIFALLVIPASIATYWPALDTPMLITSFVGQITALVLLIRKS